ncbi:hypothetical protein [Calothrix rhizosoleniae]|uniref:hypothetical protein n=1 Tax=Calothrix rhizosoleniae TaxID=888997 RepID=UPI001177C63C|nr:hypothetical protein [Calothrix rhizosoleniae]
MKLSILKRKLGVVFASAILTLTSSALPTLAVTINEADVDSAGTKNNTEVSQVETENNLIAQRRRGRDEWREPWDGRGRRGRWREPWDIPRQGRWGRRYSYRTRRCYRISRRRERCHIYRCVVRRGRRRRCYRIRSWTRRIRYYY